MPGLLIRQDRVAVTLLRNADAKHGAAQGCGRSDDRPAWPTRGRCVVDDGQMG